MFFTTAFRNNHKLLSRTPSVLCAIMNGRAEESQELCQGSGLFKVNINIQMSEQSAQIQPQQLLWPLLTWKLVWQRVASGASWVSSSCRCRCTVQKWLQSTASGANSGTTLISWWRKFLKCLSCLRFAGLYSLLVNYSLWRGKLTQISISKRYESSHFPCPPPEKRVEGDCRSSLQWYAASTGGSFLTGATLEHRESAAFYWSEEWDHWAFCARSTQRQDTSCLKFRPILSEHLKHTVPAGEPAFHYAKRRPA